MITVRSCRPSDFNTALEIINAAAERYRGVIPEDRWQVPYMLNEKLRSEIESGVKFWGAEESGSLLGVMGIQHVRDVVLIRHAYVRPETQGKGIGGQLLRHLRTLDDRPMLIGTWAAAKWAIDFYRGHGFSLVPPEDTAALLRGYWSIPGRQIETSLVLADAPIERLEALQP